MSKTITPPLSFESPCMSQSIVRHIVRTVNLERDSGMSIWSVTPEIMGAARTCDVQRLRRAARELGRQPWRDSQMRAEDLMRITADTLRARGAMKIPRGYHV